MKKIVVLLGTTFLLIGMALFYLARRGVSIRPQPLIKPTEMNANFEPMGQHLFLRLFPDFQSSQMIVWKLNYSERENEMILTAVALNWEKQFGLKPQILSLDQRQECQSQCWIVLKSDENFEQADSKFIKINGFRVLKIRDEISQKCEEQKIMNEECLIEVIPHLVRKKVKKLLKPSFFMHKYLDNNFYLFLHNPSQTKN